MGCRGTIGAAGEDPSAGPLPGPTGGAAPANPVISYATSRLTNAQYLNTVHDLLTGMTFADPALPNENVVAGFKSTSRGQTPTALLIESYASAADSIAQAVSSHFSAVVSCQPTTQAAEDSCAQSFITDFGKRAYRRPLRADEQARMVAFYNARRAAGDFPTSITAVIQVFLQSPSFLYRMEAGASPIASGGMLRLTSYELASRLSYFLVNSMPDPTLMQAADQDALQSADQVTQQARRLLSNPRARDAVATFHYGWLQLAKVQNMAKDPVVFPGFTSEINRALYDSAVQFIDHAFWQKDSLSALLTDPSGYVTDATAPYFGVPAPGSATPQLVSLDPAQRGGVLTQPGVLAGLAGLDYDSPVQRGVLVLDSLLCSRPAPPPAGVNTTPPALNPNAPMTTRQRFEQQHVQGSCAGCHDPIDNIGFAFENYDAVGAWRTEDSGLPVNASVTLEGTDVDGSLVGGVAFGQRLAHSRQVSRCVAYWWLRYALGLDDTQINLDAARAVGDQFNAAGGSFTQLLLAVVTSDAFRSLKVSN
jgi:hypothetical protein